MPKMDLTPRRHILATQIQKSLKVTSNRLSLRGAAAVVARSWALSPPSARRKRAGGEEAARSREDEREGVGCEGTKDGVHGDVLRRAVWARMSVQGKEREKTATHEQKMLGCPMRTLASPISPPSSLTSIARCGLAPRVENVADARGDEAPEGAEGVGGLGGEVVMRVLGATSVH
ncbi:hypothetical protein B0H17DRAFT_1134078 [Mycena rosella]|uniref:Uncharacterized protein n=1 Tax=Mycena rosella TaxID=1033263 RepID=A0AAD7GJF8_MYCRO|nr:hypothetical protein B0H17DRAFT_1134078 [Mycena rosella]